MATVPVSDTFLYYRTLGAGPPCLIMHGGLGIDHNAYSPGLDGLASAMTVVYYDHRCHGRSGRPDPATISLARMADDADELRQALGADRIGVLGHSFGGFVAFEYAVRHPEHLGFLIVVCSSPTVDYFSETEKILDALLTPEMRDELALPPPRTPEERLARPGILPLYFHRYRPEYTAALNDGVIHNPHAAHCSDLAGWSRWDQLKTVTAPTLLLAGRHDWIPHLPRLRRAAELLPNAELVTFEDSGHYPWLEEPDLFNRVVSAWVRERVAH